MPYRRVSFWLLVVERKDNCAYRCRLCCVAKSEYRSGRRPGISPGPQPIIATWTRPQSSRKRSWQSLSDIHYDLYISSSIHSFNPRELRRATDIPALVHPARYGHSPFKTACDDRFTVENGKITWINSFAAYRADACADGEHGFKTLRASVALTPSPVPPPLARAGM